MTKEKSTALSLMVGEGIEDGVNPQSVRCAECQHVWIGFYLPQPISVAARIMKNLTCPKCGTGSDRIMVKQA